MSERQLREIFFALKQQSTGPERQLLHLGLYHARKDAFHLVQRAELEL